MPDQTTCVIVGASHGGVSCAFALRKEGYVGRIVLIDADPNLPYRRPPLSKTFLTDNGKATDYLLRPEANYEQEHIELLLGRRVTHLNAQDRVLQLDIHESLSYDHLVLATGASALIPPIEGLSATPNLFALRSAMDVLKIKKALGDASTKSVLIIGGGYIGLEIAASLKKLGASITLLEREARVLSRVTSPEMSQYFYDLHASHQVEIRLNKEVSSMTNIGGKSEVACSDGSHYLADLIILGVGIKVNAELAEQARLNINNGIVVDKACRTSDPNIWAIGDCTNHYNEHYEQNIRLESVQNAKDQALIAAVGICGKEVRYDAIPWFWSDQYDVKLQMVGLSPWLFRGDHEARK